MSPTAPPTPQGLTRLADHISQALTWLNWDIATAAWPNAAKNAAAIRDYAAQVADNAALLADPSLFLVSSQQQITMPEEDPDED